MDFLRSVLRVFKPSSSNSSTLPDPPPTAASAAAPMSAAVHGAECNCKHEEDSLFDGRCPLCTESPGVEAALQMAADPAY